MIKNVALNIVGDKLAMGLSFLCVLHCFAVPVLIALLPSLGAIGLDDEAFHYWMLAAVVPVSVFSLAMGCKEHRRLSILLIGFLGLIILLLAAFFGHDWFGEEGEKTVTLIGSATIAFAHFRNYRRCRIEEKCHCS